jgi:MFS family permease
MSATAAVREPIWSTIPARLDRLGWSKFHTCMVAGLASPDTLNMTSTEMGLIASVYLVGQMIGALVFGRLSDQLGQRRLLVMTLLLCLLGTGAAFNWP